MKSQSILILAFIALICFASVAEASVRRRKLKVTKSAAHNGTEAVVTPAVVVPSTTAEPVEDDSKTPATEDFCAKGCGDECADVEHNCDDHTLDGEDDTKCNAEKHCIWITDKCESRCATCCTSGATADTCSSEFIAPKTNANATICQEKTDAK